LSKLHPNCEEIDGAVRSSIGIDRSSRQRTALPLPPSNACLLPSTTTTNTKATGPGAGTGNGHGRSSSENPGYEIPPNSNNSTTHTQTHVSDPQILHHLTPDPVTIQKERSRAQEWSHLYSQASLNYLRSPPSISNNYGHNNSQQNHGNSASSIRFTGIVETDLDTGSYFVFVFSVSFPF